MSISDPLKLGQEKLVTQIRNSHKLFLLHFYGAILNLLLFAAFTFILGLNLISAPWEMLIYGSPSIIIIAAILRQTKRIASLTHVSGKAPREVENTSTDTQLRAGVTAYMNQLFAAIQTLTFTTNREQNAPSNHKRLDPIKYAFEFFAYSFVIAITLFIMYFFYPEILNQPTMYVTLATLIIVTIIRIFIYHRWVKTINRWLKAYHGLSSWEEKIVSGANYG